MRRTFVLAFTAVIALAGCEEDNNAVALCTALCDCDSIVPAQYARCVDMCAEQVPDEVAPECVECVLTTSCAGLRGDACDFECQNSEEDR